MVISNNGGRTGFVRVVGGVVQRERAQGVLVAEVEVGHLPAVRLRRDHRGGVLLVEELQHEGEIVRVEEQLREIFELEHVCAGRQCLCNVPISLSELTGGAQPLQ